MDTATPDLPWSHAFPARFWEWGEADLQAVAEHCYGGDTRRVQKRIDWGLKRMEKPFMTDPARSGPQDWVSWLATTDWTLTAGHLPLAAVADSPFHACLAPLVARTLAARSDLFRQLPSLAQSGLAAALIDRLHGISHRALYALYEDWRTQANSGDFSAFLTTWRQGLAVGFLTQNCPTLGWLWALACQQWAAAVELTVERLINDAESLKHLLGIAVPLAEVTAIQSAAADAHEGGKMVWVLTISSASKVVYKPRCVAMEAAFGDYTGRLTMLDPAFHVASTQALERSDAHGAYGWSLWVDAPTQWTDADLDRYYQRAGALLFHVSLLGGRDLHMENVIASREGPVMIDAECLLQPREEGIGAGGMSRAIRQSGLLSETSVPAADQTEPTADSLAEIGGFLGEGGYPLPVMGRRYARLATGELQVAEVAETAPSHNNLPRSETKSHSLAEHFEAFTAGFENAWRAAQRHRATLELELERFAGLHARVVPRSSTLYGTALLALVQPKALRCGRAAGLALEPLLAAGFRSNSLPPADALLAAEAEALLGLDIPLFKVPVDGCDLGTARKLLVPAFAPRSGLQVARERLRGLDEVALASCVQHIRRNLHAQPTLRPATEPRVAVATHRSAALLQTKTLLSLAEQVATAVRDHLPRLADDEKENPDVYHGEPGAALFLAAIGQCMDRADHLQLASEAMDHACVRGFKEGTEWGAVTGQASLVLALGSMAVITGSDEWLHRAVNIALALPTSRLHSLQENDLLIGRAGWLAVLAELARRFPDRSLELMPLIEHAERALLDAAERGPHGYSQWRGADGLVMSGGFAHGAAGVAVALTRSARLTRHPAAKQAAFEAWESERLAYDAELGNWTFKINSLGQRIGMNAWCNGISGMALAASETLAAADHPDPEISRLLEAMSPKLVDPSFALIDHVCCGNAGRLAICQTLALRDHGVSPAFVHHAETLFLRHGEQSHGFRLDEEEEGWLARAGFFRGLSGIGYVLLRLREPTLPDVPAIRLS